MDYKRLGIERDSTVDDETINVVEAILDVRLPKTYLDLVRFNDEPEPTVNVFTYGETTTCVSEFFKFTDDDAYEHGILRYHPDVVGLPRHLIPIARDPGDFLICIDRDAGDAVVIVDSDQHAVYTVAPSFETFLESLRSG